jgi:hypothetical protein
MEDAREAPCATLEGEIAQHIARLWRELPPDGKEIRCYYPHFGLRVIKEELLELEASLCFGCHNIFGESNGARVSALFDAGHLKSQELLALQGVWNEKEQL